MNLFPLLYDFPMRPKKHRLALTISALIAGATMVPVASHVAAQASAGTAPCTTATAACAEWITLGGGPGRSMFYRTYPLDVPDDRITRALIMVHGTNRNADHYFDTAKAAAFLAGAIADTIVIAPHLVCGSDTLEPN